MYILLHILRMWVCVCVCITLDENVRIVMSEKKRMKPRTSAWGCYILISLFHKKIHTFFWQYEILCTIYDNIPWFSCVWFLFLTPMSLYQYKHTHTGTHKQRKTQKYLVHRTLAHVMSSTRYCLSFDYFLFYARYIFLWYIHAGGCVCMWHLRKRKHLNVSLYPF